MTSKPSIIIVSCDGVEPNLLIKLITKNDNVSKHDTKSWALHQPWRIDTKYYMADTDIYSTSKDALQVDELNLNVEALLLHIDSTSDSGLEECKIWEKIQYKHDPSVKLLISNNFNEETKVSRSMATKWCLSNGFELVELNACKDMESEDEIIKENIGIERVIEALHTHIWPNLVMKNGGKVYDKTGLEPNINPLINNSSLENVKSLDKNEESDDFTELFSQFLVMKESIQSMPMRERRQCAEQVVSAFWKVIGGDEEEIADL